MISFCFVSFISVLVYCWENFKSSSLTQKWYSQSIIVLAPLCADMWIGDSSSNQYVEKFVMNILTKMVGPNSMQSPPGNTFMILTFVVHNHNPTFDTDTLWLSRKLHKQFLLAGYLHFSVTNNFRSVYHKTTYLQ